MSDSIWKKEIHLRKPKKKVEPGLEAPEVAQTEPTSVWKKELHLRMPKAKKVESAASMAEATSIWKKERHLRRQPEPLPPLPAHLLEQSRVRTERPRGTVVVPVVPEQPDPVQRVERWTARVPGPTSTTQFPRPAAGEEQDPVALLPCERATVDPAPVVPALPAPPAPLGWPEEPTSASEPAGEVKPEPEPVVPPAPERVAPTTQFEWPKAPEPMPAPAEVVESDSEPVVEAAVEQSPAEKVPLLKREVSFKRKPKVEKPTREPAAKPEPTQEKVSLLKREVSFKRKPKVEKPKREPIAKAEPTEEKVSLKREISFKRKPKVETSAPDPAAEAADPPKEKVPLLKREISFKRQSTGKIQEASANKKHKDTRVVGLRIGSTQISAAHVHNNGSAQVVQLARKPLERGLIVAGEVREPATLIKELKSFFSANKLPRKDIRLGIASSRIGVRVLDVPALDDEKQFQNAVRFRAQEVLPLPVTEAVLDHVVLEDIPNEAGEPMRRILLVFAHRELVNRYVDVCKQAGLRLSGIDFDAFALLRAIGPQGVEGEKSAVVALSVGHERTVFAVSDGEVCDYTRVLEWGSGAIDVALARALNLTPSQAEPIKQTLSLDATEPVAGLSPMQFEAARSAAKAEIGMLVRELVSSLRFYQSQPESLAIREVLVCGGGAQLGGFISELERGLGARVRLADPLARVTLAKKVNAPEDAASVAVAVGLGIEG